MSLSINGKLNINDISREDFELEAKSIGLGSKFALRIYDEIQGGFEQAVKDAALELKQSGFSEAGKIAERICVNQRS